MMDKMSVVSEVRYDGPIGSVDADGVCLSAMSPDFTTRITIRPDQCHGRPCIRGMRIRVVDVLEMLANGIGEREILEDFPDLEEQDIRACLAYAVAQLGHPVVAAAE
jgi:uncharacterized protein (DUF433 family)